jgi:flagellar motility protein MotE (MotC chaperone)
MIAAALCFGLRFSQVMAKVYERSHTPEQTAGQGYVSNAELAAIETAAGEPSQPSQDALKDSASAPAAAAVKTDAAPPAPGKPEIEAPSLGEPPKKDADWQSADDLGDEYSDVKMELFSDLSKRRKDLEAKEKELAMREALLKAAQAELEQKTNELSNIKSDIESLLKQQTAQEDERIASLVKIYEGMKAKDAARIFNSLEMDVLLQVVTKMSERKSAPIIAAMDADKARNLTILLAEQHKLPDLPQLPAAQ